VVGWGVDSRRPGTGAGVPSDTGTPVPPLPGRIGDQISIAISEGQTTGEPNAPWPRIGPRAPLDAGRVGGESGGLLCTGVQPCTFAFVGREDQPGRRASPLGILEKTRSWVVEAVHASLLRATQLHVSLDAFWTQFGSDFQSDGRELSRPAEARATANETGDRTVGASDRNSEVLHRNPSSSEDLARRALETASRASPASAGPAVPFHPASHAENGRLMDTLDRSRRIAIAAARDAAARARALAEGLEVLVRAHETLVLEMPEAGLPASVGRQPTTREGELWTVAEVARYLKTSKSWVY